MASHPEPDQPTSNLHREGPVVIAYSGGPEAPDLLEVKRRVMRVLLETFKGVIG